LRELAPRFKQADVRLAVVVQAPADRLTEVCGFSEDLACIPDPEKASHRAMGLSGMASWKLFLLADLFRRRRRAAKAGFRQNWRRSFAKESDAFLVPGAALVERGGKILWLHRGEHVGDLPPAGDLLAVAQEFWDPSPSERRRS
jgi:hypothetical protein